MIKGFNLKRIVWGLSFKLSPNPFALTLEFTSLAVHVMDSPTEAKRIGWKDGLGAFMSE
jgi:hypothetical protein